MTERPDHDLTLVTVICERCHKKQSNRAGGCVRCGHDFGRYA